MLPLVKRSARRLLGPKLTGAVKRILEHTTAVAARPGRAVESPPPAPPADPPKRLLFLSDCYAQDVVWGPFHQSMLAYCGAAFERVLAVRANAFIHEWSHHPRSPQHMAYLEREIRAMPTKSSTPG
jgi:hypothetical protein